MKYMKATVSLKQLRTDPREYIRLLNSGYEVAITEHRKTIARSVRPHSPKKPRQGDVREVLRVIKSLPPIRVLDPELDTVSAVKKAKFDYLEKKYRRVTAQNDRS
jgi:antitoxin (DNA-binding transcriptional repressor) of toxin-antitoxin stability system